MIYDAELTLTCKIKAQLSELSKRQTTTVTTGYLSGGKRSRSSVSQNRSNPAQSCRDKNLHTTGGGKTKTRVCVTQTYPASSLTSHSTYDTDQTTVACTLETIDFNMFKMDHQ